MSLRNAIIALWVVGLVNNGRLPADETVLLKGQPTDAAVSNLKGSYANDANTIPVFHGRLLGCLFPCHRGVVCCEPAPVYYGGCTGGFGGGYAPPVSYGYAAPAPAYASAPAYAFAAPSSSYYAPQPARAVVTLPRLGLSFTIGTGNGLLASRSTAGNWLSAPVPPADEPRIVPPVDARPDQFRYDGGPTTPIPMPNGTTQPLPRVDPSTSPALNNRVRLSPAKPTWLAYGDRPKQMPAAPSNLLVKEGHR